MGWANDGNTITRIQNFFEFNGMLYANDRANGAFRRTGPGVWARVQIAIGPIFAGRVKEWNGSLWTQDSNIIYRSDDGINWVIDVNAGIVFGVTLWPWGFGGGSNYLYWAHCDAPALETRFLRRDNLGNWINLALSPISVGACSSAWAGWDLAVHGGNVYYASNGNGPLYYDGGIWTDDDPAEGGYIRQYARYGSQLFATSKAAANNILLWRRSGTAWRKEAELEPTGASGNEWGYISEGSDGLYVASGTVNACVYKRIGGAWVLVGLDTVGTGGSGAVFSGGELFHGANTEPNPNVRLLVPDFNVSVSGLYPQAMDVDGDGNALYLAMIDNATTFPILVKVPLPLTPTAVGAEVYTGIAGDAINVKCPVVGQSAVVAGNFGVNEQVEVTEDGGLTWADIDRDAWGAETAQPVLVDPDTVDEVMVALQTVQHIEETDDGGATAWTVRNLAVGYSPGAMARLADGDELLVGNDAGNRIDYSPNRGQHLTDITGAFAGNVAALEVA